MAISSPKTKRPSPSSLFFQYVMREIHYEEIHRKISLWKSPSITKASRIWDSMQEEFTFSLFSKEHRGNCHLKKKLLFYFFLESLEKSDVCRRTHFISRWKVYLIRFRCTSKKHVFFPFALANTRHNLVKSLKTNLTSSSLRAFSIPSGLPLCLSLCSIPWRPVLFRCSRVSSVFPSFNEFLLSVSYVSDITIGKHLTSPQIFLPILAHLFLNKCFRKMLVTKIIILPMMESWP